MLLLFALCWPGLAADTAPTLDALRSSLIGMRGNAPGSDGPRGATPQLTVAKHLLRDWAESRLPALSQSGDEGALERKLNAELRDAKLFCGEGAADWRPCPDFDFLGYLNDLKFRRSARFLILQTSVGSNAELMNRLIFTVGQEKAGDAFGRRSKTRTRKMHTSHRLFTPY